MNSRITALALMFSMLIVPAIRAEEAPKPADAPPASQKQRQPQCNVPTGSIIRQRPGKCTSNSDAKSISAEEQRHFQDLERARTKQGLLQGH